MRYHGGKWLLAPWIIEHMPAHKCYVEPFGGAASVLLRKARSHAEVYNDMDGEVVNVFRMARDRGPELMRALTLTPFARAEFEESYEPTDCPLEWARRTIVRSFMGFGSNSVSAKNGMTGFRAASRRSGTVPARDWMNYADAFDDLIERLRGVVIENRPAIEVMQAHDGDDTLHYVDPPYVHDTRGDLRHGYRFELSDDDHRALAAALRGLAGRVILSGYPSPLYDELYGDWQRIERKALADGALARIEVLWLSPNLEHRRLL